MQRIADMNREKDKEPRPFLKWVGGKTQLLPELEARLPKDFAETVRVYAEPFLGGGAFLFRILSLANRLERIVANDSNHDLANAWRAVRDHPDDVIDSLLHLQSDFRKLTDEPARKAFFLSIRSAFNAGRSRSCAHDIGRAVQLLFLNRTCFNGLYRVNGHGLFNVPFGRYANPSICDAENLRIVAKSLERVEILSVDFEESVKNADGKWFVYFDPPYRPISATSAFCDYTQGGFNDAEQRRLAECCRRLDAAGCRWMMSNSHSPDGFFDTLFSGFRIERVQASRAINSKGTGRGKISEIIVTNQRESSK